MLHTLLAGVSRLESKIETSALDAVKRDERIDGLDDRLEVLEHDRTRTQTAIKLVWAFLATFGTLVGTAIGWLFNQH